MLIQLLSNISYYLPECILVVGMTLLLLLESTYVSKEKFRLFVYLLALIVLVLAFVLLASNLDAPSLHLFGKAVVLDQWGTMLKIFAVLSTAGILYLAYTSKDIYQEFKSEFIILAFGVLIGTMLVISSANFLSLYIGIETVSILSYVLASLKKHDIGSLESGLKYSLFGALSAGVMLFGLSHLYGLIGSLDYADFVQKSATMDANQLIVAKTCIILLFAGLGFKVAAFPMHMWSPDVYQGSPTPVTAFFATVPKIAGVAAFARITMLLSDSSTDLMEWWTHFIQIIGIITMSVGNLCALNQESVKRMLAYSSMGHMGFIILAISIPDKLGISATLFYLGMYLIMTLVSFYVVDQVNKEYGSDASYFFKGLIKKHAFMAISFSIALFSLAGMPPLAGFVAKFNILSLLVENKFYTVAILVALNSVVALFYYLILVKKAIVDSSDDTAILKGFTFLKQLYICGITLPLILFGLFWDKIYSFFKVLSFFNFKM